MIKGNLSVRFVINLLWEEQILRIPSKHIRLGPVPYVTTNKSNLLERHAKTHDKEATKIECTQCGETFANIKVLNKHKKAHENKQPKNFKCKTCEKTFGYKHVLEKHVRAVHEKLVESSVGFAIFVLMNSF